MIDTEEILKTFVPLYKEFVPERATRLERLICAMLPGFTMQHVGPGDFEDFVGQVVTLARMIDKALRNVEFGPLGTPDCGEGDKPVFNTVRVAMSRSDFDAALHWAITRTSFATAPDYGILEIKANMLDHLQAYLDAEGLK